MQIPSYRYQQLFKYRNQLLKDNFQGSAPNVFVGRFNYPNINVGILSPPERLENIWEFDNPRHWAVSNYDIEKIIDFRSALVNSRFQSNVRTQNRFLDISKEVGMASKAVDIEINLEEKPFFRLNTGRWMAPTGPRARLKNARLTENPKVPTKVERVVGDTDLKATDGMYYLYQKGLDETYLTKLLSIGTLGTKANRKLVPTRWSITATDDTLGKKLIEEVKEYPESDYMAFFGGYLGNFYVILLFPGVWVYELFETYAKQNNPANPKIWTDHEFYGGRKAYAASTVGGYYANRLPILEKLKLIKRQAAVVSLRFVTDDYYLPLGVWVVRESTRKTMNNKPIAFSSKELMLDYVRKLVKKKFSYNADYLLSQSKLLRHMRYQTTLKAFLP